MGDKSLVLLWLWLSLPVVTGYAGIGVACQEFNSTSSNNVVAEENATTKYVCAVHQFYGPSPAVVNGVSVTIGDYQDDFSIIQLDNETNPDELNSLNFLNLTRTGETIHVMRYTQSGECTVSVTSVLCQSCSICATSDTSTTISTNCTNIPGGRSVTCEPLEKVFYPKEGYIRNDHIPPPTSAPVPNCLSRGAQCSTSFDCCSNRCVLNICQASNDDSQKPSLRSPGRGGAAGGSISGVAVDLSSGGSG